MCCRQAVNDSSEFLTVSFDETDFARSCQNEQNFTSAICSYICLCVKSCGKELYLTCVGAGHNPQTKLRITIRMAMARTAKTPKTQRHPFLPGFRGWWVAMALMLLLEEEDLRNSVSSSFVSPAGPPPPPSSLSTAPLKSSDAFWYPRTYLPPKSQAFLKKLQNLCTKTTAPRTFHQHRTN